MIAVIPMAGNGQRFADAGYVQPKPLLPMPDGRTLIEHVVSSLPQVDLVITISKHTLPLEPRMFAPYAWYPIHVKRETSGPLDTILECKTFLRNNDELFINYCDCFLPDNQANEFVKQMRERGRHAGVVCFPSHDPRFQRDPAGQFAMSGIFWFKHAKAFEENARRIAKANPGAVGHISPGQIAFGARWLGLNMCAAFVTNNYVDLGIPDTYEAYQKLQGAKSLLAEETYQTYDEFLVHDIPNIPKTRMGWLMYKTLKQTVTDEETMELAGMIEEEKRNDGR